jgi:hypothetical protein
MQDVFILSEDDYETDMYMLTAEIHFSNQRFTIIKNVLNCLHDSRQDGIKSFIE